MKKKFKFIAYLSAAALIITAFSGCQMIQNLTNKTPENFTEGVDYDRDFPDDILEVYDDAVVYQTMTLFNEILVFAGSEDGFDDILDFYKDLLADLEVNLVEESEDRDEYFSRFYIDGYWLRLQIKEAEGDYVEDLFDYIIILGAKEADEEDASMSVSSTPAPTPAPAAQTPTPVSDATATPAPSVQSTTSLSLGSWTLWKSSEPGLFEGDLNFQILDGEKGVMYCFNVAANEIWRDEFTYTFIGDLLTFSFFDGTSIEYEAVFDDYDYLMCTDIHNRSHTYTYYNWNEIEMINPSANNFPAYGCWLYYEPQNSYVETVTFWDDGRGLFHSNGADTEYEEFTYTYNNYTLTMDMSDGVYQYGVDFRGNVMEFSNEHNNSVVFYRVGPSILSGTYELEATNTNIDYWSFTLNPDMTAYTDLTTGDTKLSQEAYWDLNSYNGILSLYSDDISTDLNFLYTVNGIIAEDSSHEYSYIFTMIN